MDRYGLSARERRHPDFESEQVFLRHAYECLRAMRDKGRSLGDAGGDPKASAVLKRLHDAQFARLSDSQSILFGRIDLLEGDQHYIGRQAIRENGGDPIVINWRAPAAEPFYTATPDDPAGLTLRRRFRADEDTLLSIADEPFGAAPTVEPTIDDILLEELGRERTAEMRDVVATIQQDQYRIISKPAESSTIVQGGPGTGKTAVGLHRAAWLLYRYQQRLTSSRVLVVGPNPLFMKYISLVLPALGETAVDQHSIEELIPLPHVRAEATLVARVKGDERMREVLRRAVQDRVRVPTEPVQFEANRVRFELSPEAIADLIGDFDPAVQGYVIGRDRFRAALERRAAEAYGAAAPEQYRGLGPPPPVNVRLLPDFDRALDRIWPSITSEELVRQLLSSEERLERATEDILTDPERRLLYRKPVERLEQVQWTVSDVPLVDEVRDLLDGRRRRYGHVVLDEAQDLTPMQLRTVGRRIRDGSVTILGDLAQATGLWHYSNWDEIAAHLGIADTAEVDELTIAYRVPREVMEVALPVLALTAPSIRPPKAYRSGDAPIWLQASRDTRAGQAVDRAVASESQGGTVAIIAPASLLSEVRAELDDRGLDFGDAEGGELAPALELLTPTQAKGLEFDHVVLLEPAAIIREAFEGQGHKELYVALTRPTRSLTCVHFDPLPWPLGSTDGDALPAARRAAEDSQRVGTAESGEPPAATPALSVGEALLVAHTRGLSLDEALARAILALVHGASDDAVAAAVLSTGHRAGAVGELIQKAQSLGSDTGERR